MPEGVHDGAASGQLCLVGPRDGGASPRLQYRTPELLSLLERYKVPPCTGEIEDNVLANAHPGAIVIMHDGGGDRSETLDALPDIIDTLRARGDTFVTVTQLLGLKLPY